MIEFRYEPDGADLPPEKLKRQYEAIVKAGQVFLKAVLASPVVLWDRSDKNDKRMQRGAVPTRKLMMGAVLRVVTLQERLSEDAVSVIVGHHERPKVSIARTLCEHCVMAHFGVTKELPSGDPQTGWFVDFMHRVGELAGVTIGRNMVAAAIKRQRATG